VLLNYTTFTLISFLPKFHFSLNQYSTIKHRNESDFKYLETTFTLDNFSKVKQVAIEIEDVGEFGLPKIIT